MLHVTHQRNVQHVQFALYCVQERWTLFMCKARFIILPQRLWTLKTLCCAALHDRLPVCIGLLWIVLNSHKKKTLQSLIMPLLHCTVMNNFPIRLKAALIWLWALKKKRSDAVSRNKYIEQSRYDFLFGWIYIKTNNIHCWQFGRRERKDEKQQHPPLYPGGLDSVLEAPYRALHQWTDSKRNT